MRCLVCLLAAFVLTISVAWAQDPGSFYKPPSKVSTSAVGVTPTGKSSAGGISALLTMQGVDDSGRSAAYKTRPINYSPSTVGRLARVARGAPQALLVTAAFNAVVDSAGWAIDELTGQVRGPQTGPGMPAVGDGVWCATQFGAGFSSRKCSTTLSGFVGQDTGWSGGPYMVTAATEISTGFAVLQVNGGAVGGTTATFQAYQTEWPVIDVQIAPIITDAQIGEAISDYPEAHPGIIRQADGKPRVAPEVQEALDAFRNELETAGGLTPTTGPGVAPDFENEVNDTATEWPTFCGWAWYVCEFIDWVKDPPSGWEDVPMPETELPGVGAGWVSTLGSGSCPAPRTLNLRRGAVVYEWTPFCDLASRMKPLVIASAAFAALFILAGVSRRGNGDAS